MGALNNLYVSSSFQGLMKLTNSATGLTNTLQTIQAGDGSDSPLQMSLTQINISGSFTVNNLPITGSTSGTAGTSGTSGTSGSNGSSGTSGTSGSNGSSGTSGVNGTSGTSGTSGINGTSGTSGFNGSSGTSGTSGLSGTSGTSGVNGSSGTSGTSGSNGSSGTSGFSGSSGTSGSSGFNGSSGTSGTAGSSGTSGTSGIDGTSGTSGTSGSDGSSGTSGNSGSSGTSGTSGATGSSGTSGTSGIGVSGTNGTSGTSGTSGVNGSSGTSGTSGDTGASGTSGTSGRNGGVIYQFDTTTTGAGTNTGRIRYNNGSISSVTRIFISDEDINTDDVSDWILSWDDSTTTTNRGQITIMNNTLSELGGLFNVTGVTVTQSGYYEILVQYVSGQLPANTNSLSVNFSRTGNAGTSGTSGTSGVGSSGTSGTSGIDGTSGTSGTSGVSPSLDGVITTGSISQTQAITGSLIEVGNLFVQSSGQTTDFSNITSSYNGNIIFGAADNVSQVTQTGSYVISGSNNILLRGKYVSTPGYYSYISGSGNIFNSPITLSTASLVRPSTENNISQGGGIYLNYITSSLVRPQFNNNTQLGQSSIFINHQSGSGNFNGNLFMGNNIFTSNQNNIPSIFNQSITSNILNGTNTLNHISSSIAFDRNIASGLNTIIIDNHVSSSNAGAQNGINVNRNLFLGANNNLYASGSNSAQARLFTDNLIGGNGNIISSSYVSSNNSHLLNSIIYGQSLNVSGSNANTGGGSAFFGRWNATGSLQESSQETVFVVGTGTAANNRRNALRIDSDNNSNFTGSVNVSGSLTVNGQPVVTGSVSVDRNGLITTGSLSSTQAITGSIIVSGSGVKLNSNIFDTNTVNSFTGRTEIFGGDGSNGASPRLFVSGSDNASTTIARSFVSVDSTRQPSLGASLSAYANPINGASLNIGVFTPDTYADDYELNIVASSGGTQFQDFDNFNTFGYQDWMVLPPNVGNNPAPQFKRSVAITGSLRVTGGITGSFDKTGLLTTGSNTFSQQSLSGSLYVTSSNGQAIVIESGDFILKTGSFISRGAGNSVNNLAIGEDALISNQSVMGGGYNNTAIGYNALYYTTTGQTNTAIGANAMLENISGSNNLGIGDNAMRNSKSSNNVAIGTTTLFNQTTGNNNIGIGSNALRENVSGSNNIAIGGFALVNNKSNENLAIGGNALYNNTLGNINVAIGNQSLYNNTEGLGNTAIGANTLLQNVTGSRNVAIGGNALQYNTNDDNMAIGTNALNSNTSGRYNVAIGTDSQYENLDGTSNIAIGNLSDRNRQNGVGNIAIGEQTLWNLGSGSYNIGIGYKAGYNIGNEDRQFFVGHKDFGSINAERSGSLLWGQMNDTAASQSLQINAGQVRLPQLTQSTGSYIVTYDATGSLHYAPFSGVAANLFSQAQYIQTGSLSLAAGVSGSISYTASGSVNGISLVSGSQITISQPGVYNIQFSAQAECNAGADTIWMWFKKNGTNIADSASKIIMPNNQAQLMTVNILETASANDYYELVWQNLNGDGVLLGEAASGNIPAIPSVITTITQIR